MSNSLSNLSDAELQAMYATPAKGATPDLAKMSDDELLALHNTQRSAPDQTWRAVSMPAAGFNEHLATTLGAVPDLVGAGMRAVGLPSSSPGQYTDLARRGIQSVATLGGLFPGPKPENTLEKGLYGAGGGVADAASVLIPAAAVARGARAGSMTSELANALASQPATQLVSGAVGGGTTEATGDPLLGLGAALAAPLGIQGAARFAQPIRPNQTHEMQRLIQTAKDEGLRLTPGQETGSAPLKKMEQMFSQMPFTSGPQQEAAQTAREAFTRASLAKSETPGSFATPDVLNSGLAKWGGEIGDIANRNVLQVSPKLNSYLTQVEESLPFIPKEAAGPVKARLDQLRGMMIAPSADGTNATIPGASYRMMDTALGKTAKDTTVGDLRSALTDLRGNLRSAMDESISPADQAAWERARRNYANLKVTQNAMGGAGEQAATGNVPPLALRGALMKGLSEGGYARGFGDQNDLARIGQSVLRPPPDSGTPAGQLMQSPLHAAALGLAARPIQALYNTDLAKSYLTKGIPGLSGHAPQIDTPLMLALSAEQGKNLTPDGSLMNSPLLKALLGHAGTQAGPRQ